MKSSTPNTGKAVENAGSAAAARPGNVQALPAIDTAPKEQFGKVAGTDAKTPVAELSA
jgi:hypothetical protein